MAGRPTTRKPTPFGEKLISLREERGLTQTSLAKLTGIPQQRIAYFERRARSPSADFVATIATALDVPLDVLIPTAAKGVKDKSVRRRRGRPSELDVRWQRMKALPRSAQRDILEVLDVALERAERRAQAHA